MKYEKPVILNLGEMAKGVGLCNVAGSANTAADCTAPGATPLAACTSTGFANSAPNCGNGTTTGFGNFPSCSGGGTNTGLDCGAGETPNR